MKKPTKTATITPAAKLAELAPLAPVQQIICDEVAHMLVHGSDPQGVATGKLISAAARHRAWRWRSTFDGHDDFEATMKTVTARFYDEWRADLMVEWKRNSGAAPRRAVDPKTAAERVRRNILDELRDKFEDFVVDGIPEEIHILLEVMRRARGHAMGDLNELPLAGAMESVLGKGSVEFIRVPYELQEQVTKYITCLKAADACRREGAA